jgi:hypothetical protein
MECELSEITGSCGARPTLQDLQDGTDGPSLLIYIRVCPLARTPMPRGRSHPWFESASVFAPRHCQLLQFPASAELFRMGADIILRRGVLT